MAQIIWPDSPFTGQLYTSDLGDVWRWNGYAWDFVGTSGGGGGCCDEVPISVSDAQTYASTNAFVPGFTYRIYDAGVANGAWGNSLNDGYSGFVTKATSTSTIQTHGSWQFITNNKARAALIFKFDWSSEDTLNSDTVNDIQIDGVSLLSAVPTSFTFDPFIRSAAGDWSIGRSYTQGILNSIVQDIQANSSTSRWTALTSFVHSYLDEETGEVYDLCTFYFESLDSADSNNNLVPSITFTDNLCLSEIQQFNSSGSSNPSLYIVDANFDLTNNVFTRVFDENANVEITGSFTIGVDNFPSDLFANPLNNTYLTIHKFPFDVRYGNEDGEDFLIKNVRFSNILYKPSYGPVVIHDTIIENTFLISPEAYIKDGYNDEYYDTLLVNSGEIKGCHISNTYFEYFYSTFYGSTSVSLTMRNATINETSFIYTAVYDTTSFAHYIRESIIHNSFFGYGNDKGIEYTTQIYNYTFFINNVGNDFGVANRVVDSNIGQSQFLFHGNPSAPTLYIDTLINFTRMEIIESLITFINTKISTYRQSRFFWSEVTKDVRPAYANTIKNSTLKFGMYAWDGSSASIEMDGGFIDFSSVDFSDMVPPVNRLKIAMYGLTARETFFDFNSMRLNASSIAEFDLGQPTKGGFGVNSFFRCNILFNGLQSRFQTEDPEEVPSSDVYIKFLDCDWTFTIVSGNNIQWTGTNRIDFSLMFSNRSKFEMDNIDFLNRIGSGKAIEFLFGGDWTASQFDAKDQSIQITGADGMILNFNNTNITYSPGAYSPVSTLITVPPTAISGGGGFGAGMLVNIDGAGDISSIVIDPANTGSTYLAGDKLTIDGAALGGVSITDDVTVYVGDVVSTRGDRYRFGGSYNRSDVYMGSGEVNTWKDSFISIRSTAERSGIYIRPPYYQGLIDIDPACSLSSSEINLVSSSEKRRDFIIANSTFENFSTEINKPSGFTISNFNPASIVSTAGAYTPGITNLGTGSVVGTTAGLVAEVDSFGNLLTLRQDPMNLDPAITPGTLLTIDGALLGGVSGSEDVTAVVQTAELLIRLQETTVNNKKCSINVTVPVISAGASEPVATNFWVLPGFLPNAIYYGPPLVYTTMPPPGSILVKESLSGDIHVLGESSFDYVSQQVNINILPASINPTTECEQLVIKSDTGIVGTPGIDLKITLDGILF